MWQSRKYAFSTPALLITHCEKWIIGSRWGWGGRGVTSEEGVRFLHSSQYSDPTCTLLPRGFFGSRNEQWVSLGSRAWGEKIQSARGTLGRERERSEPPTFFPFPPSPAHPWCFSLFSPFSPHFSTEGQPLWRRSWPYLLFRRLHLCIAR